MKIEDFLADEEFIAILKNSSKVESLALQEYFQKKSISQTDAETMINMYSSMFNALAEIDLENEEKQFRQKIYSNHQPAAVVNLRTVSIKKNYNLKKIVAAVAAACLVISLGYFIFWSSQKKDNSVSYEDYKIFSAKKGEKKEVKLSDGTVVILNAATEIKIDKDYGAKNRDVYLQGESFFDVQHNASLPFVVHCNDMDVKALGTAFNVKSYGQGEESEATLIRGLVEVLLKNSNNQKVILHPNEKIICSDKNKNELKPDEGKPEAIIEKQNIVQPLTETSAGLKKEIAWINNQLIFENDSFEDIALLIERWYGVQVVFEDEIAKKYHFTGTFEKEKIEEVLNFLKESKAFTYEISRDEIPIITIRK